LTVDSFAIKEIRITVEIEHVFVKKSFQDFTNNTEKRYRTVITYFLRISFLEDDTIMSKFPLKRSLKGLAILWAISLST